MADEAHGEETQGHEEGGVGEEDLIAHMAHQGAGQDRGHHLGGHGGGIVVAGELADVAALAHLHHHGEGVDVDGSPGKAHQGEDDVHGEVQGGEGGGQQETGEEAGGQQRTACQDGLPAADLRGHGADGDVGDDGPRRGHQEAAGGGAETLAHDLADVGGEPGGDAVVADVPEGDGGQEEAQAPLHGLGEDLVAGAVILRQVPLGMLGFQRLILRGELGLPDGQEQDGHRRRHDGADHQEEGLIVDVDQVFHLIRGVEDGGDAEIEHAAHGAHQVDDGVGPGAQGLGGDVRHQGHRRGAVGAHGNQEPAQHHDEGHEAPVAAVLSEAVIQQGQEVHQDHRRHGAD